MCVCLGRERHLYVFFRPGVEHGGDVASIMDGDEESSVNRSVSVIRQQRRWCCAAQGVKVLCFGCYDWMMQVVR